MEKGDEIVFVFKKKKNLFSFLREFNTVSIRPPPPRLIYTTT